MMRPALSYQAYNERTYVTFQSKSKRSFRIKQSLIYHCEWLREIKRVAGHFSFKDIDKCTCIICKKEGVCEGENREPFVYKRIRKIVTNKRGDILVKTCFDNYTIFTALRFILYRAELANTNSYEVQPFEYKTSYLPSIISFVEQYEL